jgi:type I restriction enzyme M protein
MSRRHSSQVGNLESLFLRLEELVLASSGEDEFDEIYKLIIAKLWDERYSVQKRFLPQRSEQATYAMVVMLLREAESVWPGVIEPGETPLLRPEHVHVCVEALCHHTISDESLSIMDSFFEFLVSRSAKGAKGQYFTPRHVTELCVRMLKPAASETVADPACGSGGFLISTLHYLQHSGKLQNPTDVKNYCEHMLWGFDMDVRAIKVAKALMILIGDGRSNMMQLNSLMMPSTSISPNVYDTRADDRSTLTIEDAISARIGKKGYDIVLTNPPFAGDIREKHILHGYELSSNRDRIERDVLFIERCIRILRPGGRMAIVLPHNKFAMQGYGFVRNWIFQYARVLAVVGLGRNTFLPHTHQKASILFLQKHCEQQTSDKDPNIFFAISEKDGKNARGQLIFKETSGNAVNWSDIDHDFDSIVAAFEAFCRQESIYFEEA